MRVVFTSDFHGRPEHYEALADLLRAESPELLILGGDMHPEADRADPVRTQSAFVTQRLVPMIGQWKTLVRGLEVACILGNHDLSCTGDALQAQHDAGRLVVLDPRRFWEFGGISWLGLSPTPPSPFWVKDFERLDRRSDPIPAYDGAVWDAKTKAVRDVSAQEYFSSQPTLADELTAVPVPRGPWIFVCHSPPYGTKLDRLMNVSYPIGSQAVRELIEQRRPLCALHGHAHESPALSGSYFEQIGQTLCINPGQSHDRMQAVVFDTSDLAKSLRHTVFR